MKPWFAATLSVVMLSFFALCSVTGCGTIKVPPIIVQQPCVCPPPVTVPVDPPTPAPIPEPEPEPTPEPPPVVTKPEPPAPPVVLDSTPLETLTRLRATYPTPMTKPQIGELLNKTAWYWRESGLALLGKPAGNNCPTPGGVLVSCDFLVYVGTHEAYDVFLDVDFSAAPVWNGPDPHVPLLIAGELRSVVLPVEP